MSDKNPSGWSAEMDRKLAEMKADPEAYFTRARERAHRESTGWPQRRTRRPALALWDAFLARVLTLLDRDCGPVADDDDQDES